LDQVIPSISRRTTIARNQNTYAKRQREMEKKAKAEAKRVRRIKRKQGGDASDSPEQSDVEQSDVEQSDVEQSDVESKIPDESN
jgi:hypothetical protein